MRPIWIKIKGLNSFLEPQEIDFQELTGEGFSGSSGRREAGKAVSWTGSPWLYTEPQPETARILFM